ncbi:glycosyltransferase family 87 protein [Chenggangzhangella methanolivorans]|uniref:DUF2029 domain-containing protein n=1 Tax=Chenggangzhangella methanolivorans TaxID=1437009 RepID=A0A9E6URF8_9HYPH|nr:glycosyltransferase family 87 protein [Chenggangzhangella methanolivorans]QZO02225.1 DUF2029 domain-containing protein [Chenggangzhangella methanolivorans]
MDGRDAADLRGRDPPDLQALGRRADRPRLPAVAMNVAFGQNGFLTAGLLGAGLALLDRRPVAAGILIGLLTYKPQFGALIPIALLACGHWRAIASAAATALAAAGAATLAFGAEVWPAFLASTKLTNHAVLEMGWANFAELVSPFGVSRWLGLGYWSAWMVQGAVMATLAALVWSAWRRPGADGPKRALLAAGCVAASPYAYVYDLTTLGVALAFLLKDGCAPAERRAVALVCLLIIAEPLSGTPSASSPRRSSPRWRSGGSGRAWRAGTRWRRPERPVAAIRSVTRPLRAVAPRERDRSQPPPSPATPAATFRSTSARDTGGQPFFARRGRTRRFTRRRPGPAVGFSAFS